MAWKCFRVSASMALQFGCAGDWAIRDVDAVAASRRQMDLRIRHILTAPARWCARRRLPFFALRSPVKSSLRLAADPRRYRDQPSLRSICLLVTCVGSVERSAWEMPPRVRAGGLHCRSANDAPAGPDFVGVVADADTHAVILAVTARRGRVAD